MQASGDLAWKYIRGNANFIFGLLLDHQHFL